MNPVEQAILDVPTGLALLAGLSVIWILLGRYWGRSADSVDDFMLAGRKVGLALGTATAMATWVTSNTTMVAPQLALQMGVWGMVGYSLGAVGLLLFAPMARRIRSLMPHGYTSGDFFRLRYGKAAWRIFLLISVFYSFCWLISLGMAGGILIHALSGIPYQVGLTVILAICVTYTLLGGLRAVIGTDFIQVLVILIGIVILGYQVIQATGFEEMHQTLSKENPMLLDLLFPAAIMFLFNNLLFGMGEIFHSNVWWSRAFAYKEGVGFKAYLLAGLFWAPVPIAAGFVALSAPVIGLNVPVADMVGPLVAAELLGKGGAVMVFIVVFCALASSLDSLLAATSDLLVQDIYCKHLNPQASPAQLRRAAQVAILSLGVGAWLVCLPRVTTLASLLHFTGAFVAATIWPILAGLYWRRAHPGAACAAMVLGSLAGLTAYFVIGFYVAALMAAVVSMVVVLLGAWLSKARFDWANLNENKGETP